MQGTVAVPVLNDYIFCNARKDDVCPALEYKDCMFELVACAESPDEKQLRHLHQTTMTRLAFFAALPLAVLEPLHSVAKHTMQNLRKDQKKLLRILFYHIQVLLGCALLPPHVLSNFWTTFSKPGKDTAQVVACLFVLAGILRGVRHSQNKNKQKAQQERAVMTGKFVALVSGVLTAEYQPPRGDKRSLFKSISGGAKTADEEESKALIQKTALAAVHASLPPKEQKKLMPNVFNVLKNNHALDGVSMRYILALAVDACHKSTSVFVQEMKFRLETTIEIYAASGQLFPSQDGASAKMGGPNGSSPPLLLSDAFSRKYLAQACGMVIREMGKKAKGTVFWNALVLMACGDPSFMVSCEATKALLGVASDPLPDLYVKTKPKIDFEVHADREALEREKSFQAWQTLMKEEVPSVIQTNIQLEGTKKRTILGLCISRLREATVGDQAQASGACRVACAMGRCYAYAVADRPNQKLWHRANTMLGPLRDRLLNFATSTGPYGSALQYLSLKALIWLQGVDGGPLTPPIMARILSNGPCWPEVLMSDILQTLFQRCIAQPSMASYILDCVNAAVAGNPARVIPVDLVDFWFYSVQHCDKAHVLNAAVQFLGAPLPPRASTLNGQFLPLLLNPRACVADMGAVSEACSAWRKLKRTVTLWLGNAIVFLAEDHPWHERTAISFSLGPSTADVLSTEVTQSPLLMSTVSHFVHDLTIESWETRLAAAKALTCIAIQCQEPYRIQIYSVFKSMMDSADLFGLRSVLSKVLDLLDQMYSGQLMIDECVQRWGGNFAAWPAEMAESVRIRHAELLEEILNHCQVPTDLFFPLGPKSRALILGEEFPEALQSQESFGFEPPQAQYSDYLRQGSLEIDRYQPEAEDEVAQEDLPDVDDILRGSQRTQQYMNTPSLRELVAQAPAAETYGTEQIREETPEQETSPSYEAPPEPTEMLGSAESHHLHAGGAARWDASQEQGSHDSPAADRRGTSDQTDNPFNQGVQPYEASGFDTGPTYTGVQEGFPKRAAVLFDFEAEMEGELTVNIGDIINVLSEIEGGWYFASVENIFGMKNEGIVPCDYVELQED